MEKRLFTSESVTEGHPDKMCDAISDAILDALISQDPMSRVACETAITTGLVLVMGEITTNAYVDIQKLVRQTVREIGYNHGSYGFDCDTCGVITTIDEQSRDIALGVDKALEAKENRMSEDEMDAIGAGDQGMMFGFAANETEEYMPYGISMAHKLTKRLTEVRKNGTLSYLRPDGKSQVTVEYDGNDRPVRLEAVVLSAQHDDRVSQEQIHADVKKYIFDPILPRDMVDENTKFFINPTGRFVIGGPHGDSGLTGRKIIVDRSAAYAARYAKIYLEEITMALNIENIIAEIKEASILELNDLVKAIEEEFGVTAAAPVAVAAAGAADAGAAKDSFDIELTSAGDKKVGVIKVVREITGEGLKEAKAIVDGAPSVIKEGVAAAEAEEIKAKLEEAGASVTLK